MEFTKTEVEIIEATQDQAKVSALTEISELQLALVGGGVGEVVWG